MIKAWTDDAWDDFQYWLKQDKKTLKRILLLLKDIDRNGYDGIGSMTQTVLSTALKMIPLKLYSAVHIIGIND